MVVVAVLVYIGQSGHVTISLLWGNTAYGVKLSGEDLSRYSNKIESVGLGNYYYYIRLTAFFPRQPG